jgi:ABC-2 type transport system permease protein
MRLFIEVVWLAVKQQLHYRLAIFAGLVTNFFFAILRAALFIALYSTGQPVGNLTASQLLSFVAVSQGLIAFMSVFSYFDIMRTVYSGAIGADLLRPMDFFKYWLGRDLGRSLVNLTLRGILQVALFSVVFNVPVIISGWNWLGFVLTLAMSWLVSFCWRFLVNLVAFWSPDGIGFGRAAYSFSQLLSGFIVPLGLMPAWFQKAAYLTPFPSMVAMPADIFIGSMVGEEIYVNLLIQAAWLVGLFLLGQLVLRIGLRRLVVQGG